MERLRQLREEKKLTQLALAMKVDASQETISGYEIGKAMPPADMLVKLANALNTSVDFLLGITDDKHFSPLRKSDLSEKERELFYAFRALSDAKKERAIGMVLGLKD